MNSADPHQEIDDLLRSRKPDPQPSPGLEGRILAALARPVPQPKRALHLAWLFILPPALAALLLVFQWQRPLMPGPRAVVSVEAASPQPPAQGLMDFELPGITDLFEENPVETEARALQRDAGRAGRFLISCLPSITERPN